MLSITSKQSLWDYAWKHFDCKNPEQHLADAMTAMAAGTLFRAGRFGGKTVETAADVDVDAHVASGDENLHEETIGRRSPVQLRS
eukprot:4953254-Amphidinium_carterae.1